MSWREVALPYFREDHVHPCMPSPVEPMMRCPPELSQALALNGLPPDEDTARDGNCGLDAAARGLLDQLQRTPNLGGGAACIHSQSALGEQTTQAPYCARSG